MTSTARRHSVPFNMRSTFGPSSPLQPRTNNVYGDLHGYFAPKPNASRATKRDAPCHPAPLPLYKWAQELDYVLENPSWVYEDFPVGYATVDTVTPPPSPLLASVALPSTPPTSILRLLPERPVPPPVKSAIIYRGDNGEELSIPIEYEPFQEEWAEIDLDALVPRTAFDDAWGIFYPDVDYSRLGEWQLSFCVCGAVYILTRLARAGEQPGVVYDPEDWQL